MATIKNTLETNFTTKGAQRTVKETEQIGKAQTRLAQGSASAGRSFSAQSQGLGGLVGIYAAAAANVFAISAAFEALNAAAKFDTIIRGTESLANAVGTSATQVIGSLKDITEGQLSIVEAARNANLALSAGFNVEQIEQLGSVALKASRALGRDLGDSFQRLARGAIKLEPELLDELGIFTRIEPAVEAYARQVGKSVSQLTQFERRQAFANQVIKDGTEAFKDIDTSVISTQEKFERLVANFTDLALIVGSFLADSLAPLAEFLDKNLGNRIILLGSIGLLVFNSLKTVVAGFAMQGINTLSTSLAGLSKEFQSTRLSAADFSNEAQVINEQLKGQGAFVGGNAKQGAAFKKTLAEGTLSSRRAVELEKQLPRFKEAELKYQEQLIVRRDKGNLQTETYKKLLAQSEQRVIGIAQGQKLVNTRLAKATVLTRTWGTALNFAAKGVTLIGKGLGKAFALLNAIAILFTTAQVIASFFGIDLIEKATDLYNKFFQAANENAAGQETFAAAVEKSTGFIGKQADELERLNAAREANNMASITNQQLANTDTTEDPRLAEIRRLSAGKTFVGGNARQLEQRGITADSTAGDTRPDARFSVRLNERELELINKKKEVEQEIQDIQVNYASGRAKAIQEEDRATDALNNATFAQVAAKTKEKNLSEEILANVKAQKQVGFSDKSNPDLARRTAEEMAEIKSLRAEYDRLDADRTVAFKEQQRQLEIIAQETDNLENARNRILNEDKAYADNREVIASKQRIITGLSDKILENTKVINRLNEEELARTERLAQLFAEIKAERAAVADAQQITAMENLQGQIQGKLGTKDTSLVKLTDLGQAKKEGDQLVLIFKGIQAAVAQVFTDQRTDMFGKLVDPDQLEGLNASTQTIDKLQKLMTGLTSGTISSSRAAKDMVVVFDLLGKAFESGVLDKNSDLGKAIAASVSEADKLNVEFQRMDALNKKLAKTFQKSFSFLEDMYLTGKVSAETGKIAKNAEEEATFQRANLAALKQKRDDLAAAGRFLGDEKVNKSAIQRIDDILLKTAKEAFAQQIKRVQLVEKELKAQDKLLRAATEQVRVQEAKNRVAAENAAIAQQEADNQAMLNKGYYIALTTVDEISGNVSGVESLEIIGRDEITRLQLLNKFINQQAENVAKITAKTKELTAARQAYYNKVNQGRIIEEETRVAGAQGASAARLATAESNSAKLLDRSILKREDILKVEIALERTKMIEAKRSAGASAKLEKMKADIAKVNNKQDLRLLEKETIEKLDNIRQRRAILEQEEKIRMAEFDLAIGERNMQMQILEQQKANIEAKRRDDIRLIGFQLKERQEQNKLQKDKATLLLTQIEHDKNLIADQRDLLIAEGNQKAAELTLRSTGPLDDPSQKLITGVREIISNYDEINKMNIAAAIKQAQGVNAAAKAEEKLFQTRINGLKNAIDQSTNLNSINEQLHKTALSFLDEEGTKEIQIFNAKKLGLEEELKNIDKTLRKTLANMGMEGAAAERLFKDKLEQLAYELSARKKLKDLIVGITDDINGGLSNAIQKLFENAATRGASLTDGLKEIGLGMYEDIRKTIVSQTIVNPAQDMVKGFIGDITGFDLNKKGIDSVELIGGKVPVTLDGAEEGPITKVKREMKEKGEGFFTSFKEKAKGAFDTIKSSLGDFGSSAMETFRGLGSGIKNLFTGEGGILSGLGSIFRGLMGTGGADGGGLGGLLSTGFNFVTSMFAGPSIGAPMPIATGGLIGRHGVLNMAAGGQVNALRDRVPAMLEPGEFVMRRPAAKSIGAGNLSRMNATGAAGMGNVQFNIVNEGEPKEAEQQGQPKFDADKIVIDVVMRDLQSNGPIRNALRSG